MKRTTYTAAIAIALGACAGETPEPADTDVQTAPDLQGAPARPPGDTTVSADTFVTIFFTRGDTVAPVTRPVSDATLASALELLLLGPGPDERAAGLTSWFSDSTANMLRSVAVNSEGTAIVDFADLRTVIPNASSSAGSALLLRELNATVFAHPQVRAVQYRIEGSCDAFGEWLQYGCVTIPRPQ